MRQNIVITGKNIDLRTIEVSDAAFVLSLRLDPELNKYISKVEDDIKKQEDWVKTSKKKDGEWYFIIQNKLQEPVGTVRIYDIKDDSFCWGSWIVKPEARSYASFESAFLSFQYAFCNLKLNQCNFDVRKENTIALNFYLRFGATIIGETDQDLLLMFSKDYFINRKTEYLSIIEEITKRHQT